MKATITAVAVMLLLASTARAAAPKVIKASPDNGQTDVDPATTGIRIEFDQPMNPHGWSIVGGGPRFPEITGRPHWLNSKTILINVRLLPDHQYWLSINSDRFKNFRGTNGQAAEPYPISFTTAAAGAATQPAATLTPDQNVKAIAALLTTIDEDYAYRDRLKIDWAKELAAREPKLKTAKTANQFARETAALLRLAEDAHISVKAGQTVIGTHPNPIPPNFNMRTLARQIPNWTEDPSGIATGSFEGNIGYALIPDWDEKVAHAFDKLFVRMKDKTALIIDVRANGGGDELAARQVAGRFVAKPAVYSKDRIREHGRWLGPYNRIIQPRNDVPRYTGPVAVLIGPKCASSNESFILMMKYGAHAMLIGDATKGSSGRPEPHDLGNGVTVFLPSWQDQFPDGTVLEGNGIKPDITVKVRQFELRQRDPVLDRALKVLRQQSANRAEASSHSTR